MNIWRKAKVVTGLPEKILKQETSHIIWLNFVAFQVFTLYLLYYSQSCTVLYSNNKLKYLICTHTERRVSFPDNKNHEKILSSAPAFLLSSFHSFQVFLCVCWLAWERQKPATALSEALETVSSCVSPLLSVCHGEAWEPTGQPVVVLVTFPWCWLLLFLQTWILLYIWQSEAWIGAVTEKHKWKSTPRQYQKSTFLPQDYFSVEKFFLSLLVSLVWACTSSPSFRCVPSCLFWHTRKWI